jgi:hypothetical protein
MKNKKHLFGTGAGLIVVCAFFAFKGFSDTGEASHDEGQTLPYDQVPPPLDGEYSATDGLMPVPPVLDSKLLASIRSDMEKDFSKKPLPPVKKGAENIWVKIVRNRESREIARMFIEESNIRLKRGDALGAMQSRLDCFKWAMVVERGGGLLDGLVGGAIRQLAFDDLKPIISKLTGDQCLKFEEEIAKTQTYKPSVGELLENEKASRLKDFRMMYVSDENWKKTLTKEEMEKVLAEPIFSEKQLEELRNLSKPELESNIVGAYDALIANSKLSFQQAKNFNLDVELKLNPYTRLTVQEDRSPESLFIFTRLLTSDNLLRAGLLTQAKRKGTTKPFNIADRLPIDPFGSGKLKVKGEQIYSVGPDGIDDNGLTTSESLNKVQIDTKGDLLAPSF